MTYVARTADGAVDYTAQTLVDWSQAHRAELHYIQPGKPNQNADIEWFNKTYREEVLDAHVFEDLEQVRELAERWLRRYNEEQPHESLGNPLPSVFRQLSERQSSPS